MKFFNIILIILVSFGVIGTGTYFYIDRTYNKKTDRDTLTLTIKPEYLTSEDNFIAYDFPEVFGRTARKANADDMISFDYYNVYQETFETKKYMRVLENSYIRNNLETKFAYGIKEVALNLDTNLSFPLVEENEVVLYGFNYLGENASKAEVKYFDRINLSGETTINLASSKYFSLEGVGLTKNVFKSIDIVYYIEPEVLTVIDDSRLGIAVYDSIIGPEGTRLPLNYQMDLLFPSPEYDVAYLRYFKRIYSHDYLYEIIEQTEEIYSNFYYIELTDIIKELSYIEPSGETCTEDSGLICKGFEYSTYTDFIAKGFNIVFRISSEDLEIGSLYFSFMEAGLYSFGFVAEDEEPLPFVFQNYYINFTKETNY